jgi:hypothetical protein
VAFHYESDKTGTPPFGLMFEEVEKVNPDLVARGEQGKPYTVRYDAVNAILLNEFAKSVARYSRRKRPSRSKTARFRNRKRRSCS